MKLLDTVVIIGFLNVKDRPHARSAEHLQSVSSKEKDVFVPVNALIETDLLLKISGYNDAEREISWNAIESAIPDDRVVPNPISSIREAVELQKHGMDYNYITC